jgi:hypothetical protein
MKMTRTATPAAAAAACRTIRQRSSRSRHSGGSSRVGSSPMFDAKYECVDLLLSPRNSNEHHAGSCSFAVHH